MIDRRVKLRRRKGGEGPLRVVGGALGHPSAWREFMAWVRAKYDPVRHDDFEYLIDIVEVLIIQSAIEGVFGKSKKG